MRSLSTRSFLSRSVACLLGAAVASLQAWGATRLGTINVSGDNGSSLDIPVGMTSTDSVSCLQFDLVYDPARLTPGAARVSDGSATHSVSSSIVSAGRERVVLYSTNLTPLDGGYVVKIPATWGVTGAAGVSVDNVKLVTAGGIAVTLTSTELAPLVVSSPSTSRLKIGGSKTLTVDVSGVGNIQYQWYLNGVAIEGATSSSYTITSATSASFGSYSVTVHTDAGDTTVPAFSLTLSVPATLINISTRAMVKTGDSVLIPGFVVKGEAGSLKRFLVRAVGPRLADLGIPADQILADPTLELIRLHDPNPPETVKTNDDWFTSPDAELIKSTQTQVGAFQLDGQADGSVHDVTSAAMIADLTPGNYTAIARGKGTSTGIAIVEVYDVSGDKSHLVNVSNRGFVGQGQQVMIPGIVVNGNETGRFLIRAVGPGIVQFGIDANTVLKNPRISVVKAGTTPVEVANNDTWDDPSNSPTAITVAAAQAGAFALTPGSADAAVVVDLAPGAYTAVCESADGGTGTAIVEVYLIE